MCSGARLTIVGKTTLSQEIMIPKKHEHQGKVNIVSRFTHGKLDRHDDGH